jgi:hypothetical protein
MAWRKTVKIKDLLTDDETPEAIKAAATGIRKRLPGAPDALLRKMSKARDMADADPETALLVFNDALSGIYSWADAERIWLS